MLQAELEAQFHHAMQAYVSGQLAQAAEQFAQITQQWPTCVEAWFQRAEIAEQQRNFSDAITYYEKVLEQQPDIQEAWFRLGAIAAQQQAVALAIQYWEQCLSINPDYTEAHLHLGLLYARQEAPERQIAATAHFSRACTLSPDPLALLSLARTLLWQNQHRVVAPLLDAVLQYLKEQSPNPQLHTPWIYALSLSLQLAHEQGEDKLALTPGIVSGLTGSLPASRRCSRKAAVFSRATPTNATRRRPKLSTGPAFVGLAKIRFTVDGEHLSTRSISPSACPHSPPTLCSSTPGTHPRMRYA